MREKYKLGQIVTGARPKGNLLSGQKWKLIEIHKEKGTPLRWQLIETSKDTSSEIPSNFTEDYIPVKQSEKRIGFVPPTFVSMVSQALGEKESREAEKE